MEWKIGTYNCFVRLKKFIGFKIPRVPELRVSTQGAWSGVLLRVGVVRRRVFLRCVARSWRVRPAVTGHQSGYRFRLLPALLRPELLPFVQCPYRDRLWQPRCAWRCREVQ